MFAKIETELGRPEVLCYNVGPNVGAVWPPPTVEETPLERFTGGLEAGVTGAFIWSKKVQVNSQEQRLGF